MCYVCSRAEYIRVESNRVRREATKHYPFDATDMCLRHRINREVMNEKRSYYRKHRKEMLRQWIMEASNDKNLQANKTG